MEVKTFKGILIGLFFGLVVAVLGFVFFDKVTDKLEKKTEVINKKEIVDEESVVTGVVEKATPSVVTVSISKTTIDPLNFLNQFFGSSSDIGTTQRIEQDIGTGFIISSDGLIVTNKHVVADLSAKYKVVVGKDEILEVKNIYRDPLNDLAILKVEKDGLNAVTLGDSDKLKVGQSVIAIGTALGEFRSTVTTGVISGLGRGIEAGSPIEGIEKLDNVIQTDAAINPGNSGGPLFNSSGEVIGVNVAVSQSGQNIGFALPINLVKDSIDNFRKTGEFERPYIGVAYKIVSRQVALLNEVAAGAYVQAIVEDGPADKAGIEVGDIIMEIDGQKLVDGVEGDLINIINKKKIGDNIEVKIWRNGQEKILRVVLEKKVN
ncbi:MAG: trypsin-like peptidase domain-containing protein [Candidatus Shapirobacteria bacterium]|nr:trypsin-like peptidase domain-containing protein [Candidatus Shapirobacteria bacterium]